VQLFIGLVLEQYDRQKRRLGQSHLETDDQIEWVRTQRVLTRIRPLAKPPRPRHPVRRWCYDVVTEPYFDTLVTICVVVNTALMGMPYFGAETAYTVSLEVCNVLFSAFFTAEAAMKLLALGWRAYLSERANWFDLLVVVASDVGIVLDYASDINVGSIPLLARALRIGRVLRLFRRASGLQLMLQALVLTIPSLINTGGLLLLVIYVYAVVGMDFFAEVAWGDSLNRQANFQTFGSSVLMLIRAFTGEAWQYVQTDLAADVPGCVVDMDTVPYAEKRDMCGYRGYTDYSDGGPCRPIVGCGTRVAYPYFVTFILIVSFIFLNMLIRCGLPHHSSPHLRPPPPPLRACLRVCAA